MSRGVATVSIDTSLSEAARIMLLHHYDSIPVVSGTTVLGIIRLRDVLQYLHTLEAEDTAH